MNAAQATGTTRRTAPILVLVASALLLSACMDLTTDITVDDDRSGSFVLEVFPTKESLLKFGGEDAIDAIVKASTPASNDAEVTKVNNGRGPGLRVEIPDVPDVAELATPIPVAGTGATTQSVQLFTRFDVTTKDDVWRLDAELVPLPVVVAAVVGPRGVDLAGTDYTLSISLPGRVESTNADEKDGSTATWDIDAGATQPIRLIMRNEPGLGIDTMWFVVAGIAVLIVIGIFLVVNGDRARVRRKLKKAGRKAAAESAGWAPPPGTPGMTVGRPSGQPAPPSSDAPLGMYSDVSGDNSVALPVGGASWGPAPAPIPQQEPRPTPPGAAGQASIGQQAVPSGPGHTDAPDEAREPAPPPLPIFAPGWYPDPDRADGTRFWDGNAWTEHRA